MCYKGHNIQVLKSEAGFYIGTLVEFGVPYCRLSSDYYQSKDKTREALDTGKIIERNAIENELYSDGKKCLVEKC